MAHGMNEADVEAIALAWLSEAGWSLAFGPDIAPDMPAAEQAEFGEVVLAERLRSALERLNPSLPASAVEDAFRKLTRPEGPDLVTRNRNVHRMLVRGVTVEYGTGDGNIRGAQARVIDFGEPANNDWLAVNQFAVIENKHNRRPDVVLFVNGLPLGVIELKNPADETTDVWAAYRQLQTYKAEIPALFAHNELLIVSDGTYARVGTLTAGTEWFKRWRTVEGDALADATAPQLEVALAGLCAPRRFLDMVRDFVVFEDFGGGKIFKEMAGYHQFHAVQVAVGETLRAAAADSGTAPTEGDRRVGVVWHTQGSGKSLTMAFYAGRMVREPAMKNPTLVVLTDRLDLDDQLFGTFSRCHELFGQPPVQATSRAHLRELLSVASGGVVFTTIHKFFPEEKGDRHPLLSDRRNIVVIADEAHRSQYEFGSHLVVPKEGDAYLSHGFAKNMRDALPGASFIGFTGTPIETQDANTRAVFGDYISVYDIKRSVEDEATVQIYYESRLAALKLDEAARPTIDPDFDEVTEGEETERKDKLRSKWAQMAAVVGAAPRVKQVAADIVAHFEARLDAMSGKGMIVTMSRAIAVDLYREIVALRPAWGSEDDAAGSLKVVMTGSASDGPEWQQHIRNNQRREELANRFRDPADPFRLVIVRDMWLTGFDAPSLHTMYLDKPMRGHGLMQAIARVNRVFRDKPGGLIVDYLGLAAELKAALATYTQAGGKGAPELDQEVAVRAMIEKYEVVEGILHGFEWRSVVAAGGPAQFKSLPAAQEHVLAQADGKQRYLTAVSQLSQAFALSTPNPEALKRRDDINYFQAVRAALAKNDASDPRPASELDYAVRQIVSKAVFSDGVVDLFAAAGIARPDISVLSDDFLAEVRDMPQRNLAVDLLERLLRGEVKARGRTNVVQARSFAEMIERTILQYRNRAIEAAEVLGHLIEIAREMREAAARGEKLGLTEDEVAFYDALGVNDSAVAILGDAALCEIAQELFKTVRANVTIDWTVRANVKANLRVLIKHVLTRRGYPPDKQERAVQQVIEQAEALAQAWAA
jgi:type I restriction enzyme R subunit